MLAVNSVRPQCGKPLMQDSLSSQNPLATYTLQIRVRYHETDGQRRVHHANYLHYFERGRVEMLRAAGLSYKALEDAGQMLVVTEMSTQYEAAAEFDDLLELSIQTVEVRKVRIKHQYVVSREGITIVQAVSTIACVDKQGRPTRLPNAFLTLKP